MNVDEFRNILEFEMKFLGWNGNKFNIKIEDQSINEIDISNCELIAIPKCIYELESLRKLSCDRNNITKLPNFSNIEILNCSYNKLTSIPVLDHLVELICISNNLTKLPNLPKLKELYCGNNLLTAIPNLLELEKLYCYNNKLILIPNFPKLNEFSYFQDTNLGTIISA